MKRILIIIILFFVAWAGFSLGRVSGTDGNTAVVGESDADRPLFAAPPQTAAFETAPAAAKDLVLETPIENQAITDSIEISGRVKTAGQPLVAILRDAGGAEILRIEPTLTTAEGQEFARFGQTVSLLPPPPGAGSLVVFLRGADGQPLGETVVRPVRFAAPDTVTVKVFFMNDKLDPAVTCDKAWPVERHVSSKEAIYRAVLEALVAGPNPEETAQGYATALPDKVVLKSAAADGSGTVTADFTASLESGGGGSCRVTAIRAQIAATLEQFPEVRGTVIAVNGRTEDVLQP